MAKSKFQHARISGISVVVPKNEIRLEDELEYFDGSLKKVERIKKIIGISARRVAEEGVTAADLCRQAAENMFAGLGVDKNSIDALVFISQSPDHIVPATACILQDKLGLSKGCAAFDVNQGCTAYVYGLWLASSLIESGACAKVLVLVGEASARHNDPANRVITPIFGDCGTATLLERTEGETNSWYSLGTDGGGAEALMVPAGGSRLPIPKEPDKQDKFTKPIKDANGNVWRLCETFMDGGAIFNFTMEVVPDHLKNFMASTGIAPEKIDCFALHQANRQIVQAVAGRAGIPIARTPTETVMKYGNQAGASIPSLLADQLADTMRNGSPTVLLSGYGVGLSWASAIVTLDHVWCSGIREYENPGNLPTKDEMVERWVERMSHYGEIKAK